MPFENLAKLYRKHYEEVEGQEVFNQRSGENLIPENNHT